MSSDLSFVSEPLNKKHLRDAFDCGQQPLNDYLKKFSSQDQKRHLAVTYVLTRESEVRVLISDTLSNSTLSIEELLGKFGKKYRIFRS